jgi:hypothetical protein
MEKRFLFVVVSRQTKKAILCALCASAVNKSSSAFICVNLRVSAVYFLMKNCSFSSELGFLCVSFFVCFPSFVVTQFVTTKSTKVTKFGSFVMPETHYFPWNPSWSMRESLSGLIRG